MSANQNVSFRHLKRAQQNLIKQELEAQKKINQMNAEKQLGQLLNEPLFMATETKPQSKLVEMRIVAKKCREASEPNTRPFYSSRVRLRDALAGCSEADLKRVILVANELLQKREANREKQLAIVTIQRELRELGVSLEEFNQICGRC